MTAQMSVRFILALTMQIYLFACLYTNISLSAGIGRQCELKIRWFNIVNVQVVSWIFVNLVKGLVHWQILWYNSRFTFSGLFNGFEISVVLIYSREKKKAAYLYYGLRLYVLFYLFYRVWKLLFSGGICRGDFKLFCLHFQFLRLKKKKNQKKNKMTQDINYNNF